MVVQVGRAVVTVRVDLVVLWGRAAVHVVRVAVQADPVVRRQGMNRARTVRDGRRGGGAELEGGAGAVDRAQIGGARQVGRVAGVGRARRRGRLRRGRPWPSGSMPWIGCSTGR